MSDSESSVIYSTPLHSLTGTALDIASSATSCRIRLLHCEQFLTDDILAIHEFPDFPSVRYTTISYVWKGLNVDPNHADNTEYGSFSVKGAEDVDPISIDVLKHACTVAVQKKSGYIWFDRLCILQTNRDDKAWQIRQMFNIYKSCALCIVLPGGVRRLAQFDENTTWMHRSWTLQEVLAQPNVMVLYAWTYGKALSIATASAAFSYTEAIQGQSAICPLSAALQCSIGGVKLTAERRSFPRFSLKLLGNDRHVDSLLVALGGQGINSEAGGAQSVWRCSLMRTSSFPVDTVLSIMGIFGVTLDPHSFRKEDKRSATIALSKEILKKGGKAHWLAPSLALPPEKGLSAFPQFPQVSVSGEATLTTEEGTQPVAKLIARAGEGWLDGIPTGVMDDAGCFTFSCPAALLVPTGCRKDGLTTHDNKFLDDGTTQLQVISNDGAIWRVHLDSEETHRPTQRCAFIVFIGSLVHYSAPVFECFINPKCYRALLLEEHEPGKFHRTSYFILHESYKSYINSERCKRHTFCLG